MKARFRAQVKVGHFKGPWALKCVHPVWSTCLAHRPQRFDDKMELNGTAFPRPAFHHVILASVKDAPLHDRALVAILAVLLTGIGLYLNTWQGGPDLPHIPILPKQLSAARQRSEFRHNAKAVLQRGYETVRYTYWPFQASLTGSIQFNKVGKPFQVPTVDGTCWRPPKHIFEEGH